MHNLYWAAQAAHLLFPIRGRVLLGESSDSSDDESTANKSCTDVSFFEPQVPLWLVVGEFGETWARATDAECAAVFVCSSVLPPLELTLFGFCVPGVATSCGVSLPSSGFRMLKTNCLFGWFASRTTIFVPPLG
eukprot:TRINITY_DN49022_c0_g1_i1.p3 TRINITY_DN49022_c0_g1~~TRINITY_DN49022_c0_g1_i1.p3  ORF type:complete len:134 (-),score=9.11 TRINITY_DN49022_c0_g1_i1:844-1245(-)